jgi:hypothetical protein
VHNVSGIDELFGKCCIIFQIIKRHFRLYHPELRQVARRVGVFGAECRAKGVDIAKAVAPSSPSSWPLTVRLAARPKKSSL